MLQIYPRPSPNLPSGPGSHSPQTLPQEDCFPECRVYRQEGEIGRLFERSLQEEKVVLLLLSMEKGNSTEEANIMAMSNTVDTSNKDERPCWGEFVLWVKRQCPTMLFVTELLLLVIIHNQSYLLISDETSLNGNAFLIYWANNRALLGS